MKNIYFILFFTFIAQLAFAQEEQSARNKHEDIEALKVAFISRELSLSPEDAQKFWPLYNQYSKELHSVKTDAPDMLERDEKVLNLRKRYKEPFTKILGQQRVNNMYNAEGKFRQLLFKAMRQQRSQGPPANGQRERPLRRSN